MALGVAVYTGWFAVLEWRRGNRLGGAVVMLLAPLQVALAVYLLARGR